MFKEIAEQAKKRQTLLTVFAVLIVIFGGVQIIDDPQRWWVVPSVLIGILAIILVFIYAKVVFKILISFIVMSFSTYYAFMLGTNVYIEENFLAEIWAMSITLIWFLNLALSYLMQSVRSRWTMMMFGTLAQFFAAIGTIDLFNNLYIGVSIGAGTGVLVFIVLFKMGIFLAHKNSHMPVNVASDILTRNVRNAFEEEGWTFRDLRKKGNKGGYLVFKDSAYYIHPVRMMQEFTPWKNNQLRYHEKRIDKWLSAIAYRSIPVWKARFAPVTPVLLDISNANGGNGKAIGVQLPDSRKQMPFGVFPGREINSSRADKAGIVQNFDNRFSGFTGSLSEKQKSALDKISQRDLSAASEES